MRLRGIDYGKVWIASGSRGFFGEGYWFHRLVPGLTVALQSATFVAKTVTTSRRKGNMRLDADWRPEELFPDCIKVDFIKGIAVNAVGLSNFGIRAALATHAWQQRDQPFMLSFAPTGTNKEERLLDTKVYVDVLLPALETFNVRPALQVNLSCPNTEENLEELQEEAVEILMTLHKLQIPLVPKFNVRTSPETVAHIAAQVELAGVCISNTILYGELPDKINWKRMFGENSPLPKEYGSGGLSGSPLFPLVLNWVEHAAQLLHVPINAGGGIMDALDVHRLFQAGAKSVSIGSVIMLRPWRVQSIVDAARMHME